MGGGAKLKNGVANKDEVMDYWKIYKRTTEPEARKAMLDTLIESEIEGVNILDMIFNAPKQKTQRASRWLKEKE